jgi:hypothetical protein
VASRPDEATESFIRALQEPGGFVPQKQSACELPTAAGPESTRSKWTGPAPVPRR